MALTFIYTSCPLPNYCFRLSNNFARLQKRFARQLGQDLVLLSMSFDPVHDRPEVLAKYASAWKADPGSLALPDRAATGCEGGMPYIWPEFLD